ncbi:helix-turn-helix transcriptional regulator [Streptomyces sp. NPDC093970]|uniref:PadR family transcriptional regulator n=1 Tax=Streptomyces sp. NPDC093970 TaxID=3155076 RepID=UPI00342EFE50
MTALRLTKPTIAVLEVLLASATDAPAWGLRICREADLGPGTVYPILERLEERKWVESRPESGPHPGRPARRYYELTGLGRSQAITALEARTARRLRLHLSGGAG